MHPSMTCCLAIFANFLYKKDNFVNVITLQVPRERREMLVCKVCQEPQVLKVQKVLKEKEVKQINYSF